jgi:AcrR family transcriptional regulator
MTRVALTRQRIADAALDLVDDAPLQELTMRRLATVLRVDPMAIYRHVTDKRDLIGAMADGILERALPDLDDLVRVSGSPRAVIAAMGRALFRYLIDHPEHVRVLVMTPTTMIAATYSIQIVAFLISSGFDEARATRCLNAVVAYLIGAALLKSAESGIASDVDPVELAKIVDAGGAPIDAPAVQRVIQLGSDPDVEVGLLAILGAFL